MEGTAFTEGETAADLMLREPKTLPSTASVDEVRAQLSNPRVKLVLLADGEKLVGTLSAVPAGAGPDEHAVAYADPAPPAIAPSAPARVAFDVTAATPNGRAVVLDDDGRLAGLLCLNPTRTRFCRTPDEDC